MAVTAAITEQLESMVDWNRTVYKYDQAQRRKREFHRMDWQFERFALFREDIANLVELTMGRMEMYHAVGALLLESTTTMFTEGRVDGVPIFVLSIFMMTTACAWIFLLISIWLAVHASIASKSFGARLRLRYVRLPLPTNAQIDALSSNLSSYECQGLRNIIRIPFVQSSQWKQPTGPGDGDVEELGTDDGKQSKQPHQRLEASGVGRRQYLGKAEIPFGPESELMLGSGVTPGEHIELFRRLQAKWNTYDSYARVSMSIGVQMLLTSLAFFAIQISLIENDSVSLAVGLVVIMTAARAAISVLDVAAWSSTALVCLAVAQAMDPLATLIVLAMAKRTQSRELEANQHFEGGCIVFLTFAAWWELTLLCFRPTHGLETSENYSECRLPGRLRATYYLDVFGEAEHSSEASSASALHDHLSQSSAGRIQAVVKQATVARKSVAQAQEAQTLWDKVPQKQLDSEHRQQLAETRSFLAKWEEELNGQISWCVDCRLLEESWARGKTESDSCYFRHWRVGPLQGIQARGQPPCYLDAYSGEYHWEETLAPENKVVTLDKLDSLACQAEDEVRALHHVATKVNQHLGHWTQRKPVERTREIGNALLPWRIVWGVSRCVQCVSIWLFIVTLLRELGITNFSRRLHDDIQVQELDVEWPQGSFFRPLALSQLPKRSGSLIVRTPFVRYEASQLETSELRLEATVGGPLPSGAVEFCTLSVQNLSAGHICFAALPVKGGVSIWRLEKSDDVALPPNTVILPDADRSWRSMTAAVVPCNRTASSFVRNDISESCVLMAGWDGRRISVVTARFSSTLPNLLAQRIVTPYMDIPLSRASAVLALHLDSNGERLWALLEGDELRAWDVLRLASIGTWRLLLPTRDNSFQARAISEDGAGNIVILGHRRGAGAGLLRVPLSQILFLEDAMEDLARPVVSPCQLRGVPISGKGASVQ